LSFLGACSGLVCLSFASGVGETIAGFGFATGFTGGTLREGRFLAAGFIGGKDFLDFFEACFVAPARGFPQQGQKRIT
jgi:hypothetical protein